MAVAGTIKTLLVKLGVDSADYERKLTAAEKRAKKFDKVLTGAFAGAALAATALAVKSTMLAARVETLGVVVTQLGKSANYTQEQLDKYEESIKSQGITTKNTLQSMAQMMQAQIDLAHGADLARIAQDNAVIANINSSEAFKRLVIVLQTGNVLMGRRMGLELRFGDAQKRLADELGKTTEELNQQEIMQSRLNEVKRAGVAIEGTYTAAMGTAGKTMLSLDRQFEEVSLMIGNIFLPILTETVTLIYENVKALNKLLKTGKDLQKQERDLAKEIAKAGGSYEDLRAQLGPLVEEQGKYLYSQDELLDVLPNVFEAFEMMKEGYRGMNEEFFEGFVMLEKSKNAHEEWRLEVLKGVTTTESGSAGVRAMGRSLGNQALKAQEAHEGILSLWDLLKEGPSLASDLENQLEQIDYAEAGAGAVVLAQEEVEAALEAGLITREQADEYFGNLYVAAQQIEVELGNISAYQAALNIREHVGGSLQEARDQVGNIDRAISAIVRQDLELIIKVIYEGAEPPGGQHGLSMTVPPGFPNDSFPIMATSGEHVEITPQGGGAQDNRQFFSGAQMNFNREMDEEVLLEQIRRISS